MHFKLHHTSGQDQPFHSTIILKNGQVGFTSETYHNFKDMVSTCISVSEQDDNIIQATFPLTTHQQEYILEVVENLGWTFKPE